MLSGAISPVAKSLMNPRSSVFGDFPTSVPPAIDTSAWAMQGNGGNKVVVVTSIDVVDVITSTNFSTRGMHQQADQLVNEFIVPGGGALTSGLPLCRPGGCG